MSPWSLTLLALRVAPRGLAGAPSVREGFAERAFPWYDARADRVRPLLPWPDLGAGTWKSVGDWFRGWTLPFRRWYWGLNSWRVPGVGGLGDLVVIGLAMLLLTLVLVGLLELLRRYRAAPGGPGANVTLRAGTAARVEGLPAGVRLGPGDPWDEAQRRRARGDFAGAVVYLFAHQLLTLERLKQVRLVPGRTGRQLVRGVSDRALRAAVEPTLRLFEAVYYGHQAPGADAFEAAWAAALGFEQRAGGAAS